MAPSGPLSRSKALTMPTKSPAWRSSSMINMYVVFSNSGGYSFTPVTATLRRAVSDIPAPSVH